MQLSRSAAVARPEDGSHLALQGRLLWDRGVTRKTKGGGTEPEMAFVPVAGADWQPGDAVQFVVAMPRDQAWMLQNRADDAGPLRVRVAGSLPTATRPVFEKSEAPPSDAAVLVEVVASNGGEVQDTNPSFDRENTKVIGLGASGMWTLMMLTAGLTNLAKSWAHRRRQAKQPA